MFGFLSIVKGKSKIEDLLRFLIFVSWWRYNYEDLLQDGGVISSYLEGKSALKLFFVTNAKI